MILTLAVDGTMTKGGHHHGGVIMSVVRCLYLDHVEGTASGGGEPQGRTYIVDTVPIMIPGLANPSNVMSD